MAEETLTVAIEVFDNLCAYFSLVDDFLFDVDLSVESINNMFVLFDSGTSAKLYENGDLYMVIKRALNEAYERIYAFGQRSIIDMREND